MKVVEIFESMQGEGENMGIPCVFIRLAGCNCDCDFCDEKQKYDKAQDMSIKEIVDMVNLHSCLYTVITGGEPTLHKDLPDLTNALFQSGHFVCMETNGILPYVDSHVMHITVSPKGPKWDIGLNMHDNRCNVREVKLVVDDKLTFEKAVNVAVQTSMRVWLQPCDGPYIEESKKKIVEWLYRAPSKFRAGIQLHKYYDVC